MKAETILKIGSHIEMKQFEDESYLIINDNTGKYIKISTNFYKLIKLINGTKTSKETFTEFNENNSNPISEKHFEKIIEKLVNIGIFYEENLIKKKKKLPEYLTIGFIFFPKKFVEKCVPHFAFMFHKKVAMFAVLFCLCFLAYIFHEHYTTNHAYNFAKILLFYFLVKFGATMIHELGHATATHFYKAKHGGIGFGLYLYFMPVFFADVTDIWRLSRWQRIVVNVSGVYFEIIFCVFLAILSLIFKSTTLFGIASILSVTSLYNLLPYFRLDGYWVLSDYINQPNLMVTSFAKGKNLILFKFKNFKTKDYFLSFYGIFNFSMIVYFVGFMLIYNMKDIVFFPNKVYYFFTNLNNDSFIWTSTNIFSFFPVLLVYFFGIRILIGFLKKYILKSKKNIERSISVKSF